MRIRFISDYLAYPAGSTTDVAADGNSLPPGVADELVRRGIAEVVDQERKAAPKRSRRRKG